MGRLTTHVLDTSRGLPAGDLHIEVMALEENDAVHPIKEVVTNADGRTDRPLLEGPEFTVGEFELRFHVGAYFRSLGLVLPDPPFLDIVCVRFGVANADRHTHVPLLVSPFGYSTYRGS
ncbi:MAG: hydroxyisourate hydrolase [Rhodospirillales bacterium]|jgi:5-hydroxyisourate hydrolase